ncbi:hypothetical protein CFI11_12985 [Thalassococcus sp. S3]|nr:hypothetical protein CFI11_12985 [Thalassococcus sp. S3]
MSATGELGLMVVEPKTKLSILTTACTGTSDSLGFCKSVESEIRALGEKSFCEKYWALCKPDAGDWSFTDGKAQALIEIELSSALPGGSAFEYWNDLQSLSGGIEKSSGRSGVVVLTAGGEPDPSWDSKQTLDPSHWQGEGVPKLVLQFGGFEHLWPVSTRVFSGPAQYPPSGFFGYGMLIYGETTFVFDETSRNVEICRSYFSSMQDVETMVEAGIESEKQFITVFPIVSDSIADKLNSLSNFDCETALLSYGHVAAELAMVAARRAGFSDDTRGPWLIGWVPSSKIGAPDQRFVSLDLSEAETYNDAFSLFRAWGNKIYSAATMEDEPELTLRDNLRDLADDLGENVLKVFGF